MKKILLVFCFLFTLLIVSSYKPNTIFAHILKTNGSIGAVIHVDLDDDPIIGKNSTIYLEFKDKEGKFKPENCLCNIVILQAGNEIYRQPLFSNNPDPTLANASLYFTFPEKNIYTVKVEGKALDNTTFKPFTFSYDFRVTRKEASVNTAQYWISTHVIHLIVAIIILLVVLILGISFKVRGKTPNNIV